MDFQNEGTAVLKPVLPLLPKLIGICLAAEPCPLIAGGIAGGIAIYASQHARSDNKLKPDEATCRKIVRGAKNTCTNRYPVTGARGNQLGAWRACVRQIVEPTGCDF